MDRTAKEPTKEKKTTDNNRAAPIVHAVMEAGGGDDGGPRFKDQVSARRRPGEAAAAPAQAASAPWDEEPAADGNSNDQAPPAAKELPNFKDQARSAEVPSSNNNTPGTPRLGAVRMVPPGAVAAASEDDNSSPSNDEESLVGAPPPPGDPSLINAVLVDDSSNNKSILHAEVVVHNKWRRILILVIVMAVVLAIGIVAGVCVNGSCGGGEGDGMEDDNEERPFQIQPTFAPAPLPPTEAPTEAAPSCPLDFTVGCSLPEDFIIPSLPCLQYRRPNSFSDTTCMDRPIAAELLFNGGSCSDSDNQQILNFTCNDFNGGPPPIENEGEEVHISVIDDFGAGDVLFEGLVPVGESFSLYNNGALFGDFQQITISTPDQSTILEEVLLSITCSSDREHLSRYGAIQIFAYYNNEQGYISALLADSTTVELLVTAVLVPETGVESVELTSVSVAFDNSPPEDITDDLPQGDNATADFQKAIQFQGSVSVDSFSLRSYRIDFSYEGLSTGGNDTALCTGTDSASFVFGLVTN